MSGAGRSGRRGPGVGAGRRGRGRAEGRAVTGGAGEEGAKEEEEVVRIVNREVVAGFWGLGGIDTPLMRVERGFAEGFRRTGHTGNCLRGIKILEAVECVWGDFVTPVTDRY